MPTVMIECAGRHFPVGCGEGQEERVRLLAKKVDAIALDLDRSLKGAVSEAQLFMMTALMIADELMDLKSDSETLIRHCEEAETKVIRLSERVESLLEP